MASAMPATGDHVGLNPSRSHRSARARRRHVSPRTRSKKKCSIVQVAVRSPMASQGLWQRNSHRARNDPPACMRINA
jgi:hypothetical protein